MPRYVRCDRKTLQLLVSQKTNRAHLH